MSDTVNQAGKWLGLGWNELGKTDPGEYGWDMGMMVLDPTGGPLALYGAIESIGESQKGWDKAGEMVKAEEKIKKDEEAAARQQILDIINRPPPEQPTFEWPTYEMPQIPQWTPPPTQVATPPATEAKKTYQPRRTTTVLTKPGDVSGGGKGKKKLLGE